MPNYQEAKIYAIRSNLTDKIYIGSTCQPLSKRFYAHKKFDDHSYSSKEIIHLGDSYIELIENYPCSGRDELNKREGHHIRSNNCVNKKIAGRIRKESMKEYYENNKDKLKENMKLYNKEYYLKQKSLKNQTN
jgi:hypothetical protein